MRILVVEDHTDSRELLCDALEFSGFEVLQAVDGEQGEQAALNDSPDAIVLDMSLPIKSGWDVAESLRSNKALAAVPILALTAHARKEDEERALAVGCSRYLSKPIKPTQVIRILNEVLQRDANG